MTGPMPARNPNELQGHWILRQGWVSRAQIAAAFERLPRHPGDDLAGVLLRFGLIDRPRAEAVRAAVRQASSPGPGSTKAALTVPSGMIPAAPARLPAGHGVGQASGLFHSAGGADSHELGNELPRTGDAFQDYELLGEVSRGAMGVVFRARRRDDGEVLALKVMLADNPDPTEIARFKREVNTLLRLSHPNIVEVRDCGAVGRTLYFAMELVEGRDLWTLVNESVRSTGEPPDQETTTRQILAVAKALDYCHEQGFCHRDLKPQNILIEDGTGRPVLVDFGLMKKQNREGGSLEESIDALTKTGEIVGTPAFMAPEQFTADGTYGRFGPRSDVWGLVATLAFAVAGRPPFFAGNIAEIFRAIATAPAPDLTRLNPEVPTWLNRLVRDALAKHCEQRPSMGELVERLEAGLAGQDGSPSTSRRLWLAPAAIVVLVGLAGLAFQLTRPLGFSDLRVAEAATTRASVLVSGRLNGEVDAVRINSTTIEPESDRRFQLEVPLIEGANRIEVCWSRGGTAGEPRVLEVLRDSKPPELSFDQPVEPEGIVLDGDELSGTVKDAVSEAILELDGSPVKLGRDGRFRLRPTLTGGTGSLALIVRDSLGNTLRRDLVLFRADELARRRATELRPLLEDLGAWDAATPGRQDLAVRWLASRLAPAFQHRETVAVTFAGKSRRVAVFHHLRSDLEFVLVPGGELEVLRAARPEAVEVLTGLALVARSPKRLEIFHHLLAEQAFSGIRRQIAELYKLEFGADRDAILAAVKAAKGGEERLRRIAEKYLAAMGPTHPTRRRRVRVKPFLLARTELTISAWDRFGADDKRRKDKRRAEWSEPNRPIHNISYEAALAWLRAVGDKLRLPERSEWSWACMASPDGEFPPAGDEAVAAIARFADAKPSAPLATDVQPRAPNGLGLLDMLGNVSEWADPEWRLWRELWLKGPRAPGVTREKLREQYDEEYAEIAALMGGDFRTRAELASPALLRYMTKSATWQQFQGMRQSFIGNAEDFAIDHVRGMRPAVSLPDLGG